VRRRHPAPEALAPAAIKRNQLGLGAADVEADP